MSDEDKVVKDEEAAADAARINEQCFLIDNMDLLTPRGDTVSKERLVLANSSIKAADVISLLSKGNLAEDFLKARPAQLAYLVPQLRLYIPSEDPSKKDSIVYFSEYYAPPGTLDKYDGTSSDSEGVIFRENGRGRGAGISQFSFALDNKHPGAISFVANLEIKFSSIRDLAEGPYVSLISPQGVKNTPGGGKPKNIQEKLDQELKALEARRKDYKGKRKTKGKSVREKKNVKGVFSPRSNRLKAVVGWAIPSFNDQSVIPMGDKSFYESVKSNQMVLLMSMTNYKLTFGESGEATLSIDYAASIEESFSGPQSNIFPDNSVIGRQNKLKTANLKGVGNLSFEALKKSYGEGTQLFAKLVNPASTSEKMDTGALATFRGTIGLKDTTTKTLNSTISGVDDALVKLDLRILQKELAILEAKDKAPEDKIKTKKGQISNTKHALTLMNDSQRKDKYEYYLTKLTGTNARDGKVKIVNVPESLLGIDQKSGTVEKPGSFTTRTSSNKKRKVTSVKESGTSAIGAVVNAEAGEKRGEAMTKVKLDKRLNPLATKPGAYGTLPVRFVLFGDILDAMIEVVRASGVSESQKIILGTVAVPSSKLVAGGVKYISISDIPVSLNAFQVFFLDRVIKPQKTAYPMRLFIQDLLRFLLEPAFNQCFGSPEDGGVSFETTFLSTSVDIKNGAVLKETDPVFKKLSNRDWNHLVNSPEAKEYMIIYSQEKKEGNGKFDADKQKGVYHLILGAESGLVKSFSFSAQDNQYLQTQNIVNAANGGSELGVLAFPQDASITMIGNNLFRTGQTIYINADFAMGKRVARELKMGGYYTVTKVSNSISSSGFETSLECRWTNFPQGT
jgi:hypothetical protein